MRYWTTTCGGNRGRGPRIQIRQHMLHVNGEIHLTSASIPGHKLMRDKQRSHSSATTKIYCTLKMEVAGYYETFILDDQTALLYHGGQNSFLWKVGSCIPNYMTPVSLCRGQQPPRKCRQRYQSTRHHIPQHFNRQHCRETLRSPTQKQYRNDNFFWSNL